MIRTVTAQDRESIRLLLSATEAFRPEELLVAMELVDAILDKGSASGYEGRCFFREPSRLAGYICYGQVPLTDFTFDLYWIAVDPTAERRGIGLALMACMESHIATAGGTKIFVETSSTPPYEKARRLYQKCGYSLAAVFEDFYRPGDHKLVFLKDIVP